MLSFATQLNRKAKKENYNPTNKPWGFGWMQAFFLLL